MTTRANYSERWKMINNCDIQSLVVVVVVRVEKWCLNMLTIFIFFHLCVCVYMCVLFIQASWRSFIFLSKYGASVIVYLFILFFCDVVLFISSSGWKTHKKSTHTHTFLVICLRVSTDGLWAHAPLLNWTFLNGHFFQNFIVLHSKLKRRVVTKTPKLCPTIVSRVSRYRTVASEKRCY